MSTAASSSPPAPRHKKRWLLRIAIVLFSLIVLIAAVVQIILWTDLPRAIVVGQLEKQLGLRLSVGSLSTGWLGHTKLNHVTISLPLAEKAFLDVPVMKVKNTSLFGLLLGRSVEVKAIELDQPHLYATQDSAGEWDLQQLAELLARVGGKKTGEESAAESSPAMPNVHLVDGVVTVTDNQKRRLEITSLSVEGYADTSVSWKYDLKIPDHVGVSGRLVPGGNWAHEVTIHIQNVSAWAKPWTAKPPDVTADLRWSGALSQTGVAGRLEIHNAAVKMNGSTAKAHGALSVSQMPDGISVRPDDLICETGQSILPEIKLASGSVAINPATSDVKVVQLLVSVFGGAAKVNADCNLNTGAGQLNAEWEKLALGKDITHSGGLAVTIRKPFKDRIIIDGHLTSVGSHGPGAWLASMNFSATGKSFSDFDWKINADKAQFQRYVQNANLDGLAMSGSLRDDAISLASISLPNKDLISGTASYHFSGKQEWKADLQGQHWPSHLFPPTELGFELAMHGNNEVINFDNVLLKSPDAAVGLKGTYAIGKPKPVDVELSISNAPPTQIPAAFASSPRAKIINGAIDGHFKLAGTINPLQLQVGGTLDGSAIEIRGHYLGELRLVLADKSRIDADGVAIHTEQLGLLGGQWDLAGIFTPKTNDLEIDVGMKGASLKEIAEVFDQKDIDGTLDANIPIRIPGLKFNAKNIRVLPARIALHNVNSHGMEIDQIDATVAMDQGKLTIDPMHISRQEGTGDLHFAVDLADYRRIEGGMAFKDWPYEFPGAEAHVTASIAIPKIAIQLPDPHSPDVSRQKFGIYAPELDLETTALLKNEKIGGLTAHAGIEGMIFDVRGVHGQLLGGRIDGQAYADLNQPLRSTAEFTWQDLSIEKLALIFPQIKELHGSLNGDLRIQPPTTAHPRGPLSFVLSSRIDNGGWRTLPITDFYIAGYFGPNTEVAEGGWRLVLEDSSATPSYVRLADGTVELWGRYSFHGRASSSQMLLVFRDLDLNKIVHAFDRTAAEMRARLAGNITLLRAPIPTASSRQDDAPIFPPVVMQVNTSKSTAGGKEPPLKKVLDPIYGEGSIQLSKANLLSYGPFAMLYSVGHLGFDHKTTDGKGNVHFHFERSSVTLDRMLYDNRGQEIRGLVTATDVWKGADSPVKGTFTLNSKPLGGRKLPLFADLSGALDALQNSVPLFAVRVDGTLHDPKPAQLGISQLGEQMKQILVGDAEAGG